MVPFSSPPLHVVDDDPQHFHQQQQQQPIIISTDYNYPPPSSRLHIPIPPPGMPTRPASMPDKARVAKLPIPEAGLKCPRCDSTNTKFCYFNNYSLSQPRHFCKACRRYWTRGGALRNVPVGGGCRRNYNKRTSTGNKVVVGHGGSGSNCSSTMSSSTRIPCPLQHPHLPFLLAGSAQDQGLQLGSTTTSHVSVGAGGRLLSTSAELCQPPLRLAAAMRQFPFLTGLMEPEPPPVPQLQPSPTDEVLFAAIQGVVEEISMEDSAAGWCAHGGVNRSKNLLGILHHGNDHHHQYNNNWSTALAGSAWPDLE